MPQKQAADDYYCGCHDCAAESWILQSYCERINNKTTPKEIREKIMQYLIIKHDIYDPNTRKTK